MRLKNHMLTDFNNPRWNGVVIDNVIKTLNDLCQQTSLIYGKIHDENDDSFSIELQQITHVVTNVYMNTVNNCVYGDVEFLETENGKLAKKMYNAGWFFGIKGAGDICGDMILFDKIYSWDLMHPNLRNTSEKYLNSVREFFNYPTTSFK